MRTHNTGVFSSIPTMYHNQNAVGEEGNEKPPNKFQLPIKTSEPCLWFLLRSKSSMQRSFLMCD